MTREEFILRACISMAGNPKFTMRINNEGVPVDDDTIPYGITLEVFDIVDAATKLADEVHYKMRDCFD